MNSDNGSRSDLRLGVSTAERLNQGCFCITLDRSALRQALDAEVGAEGFADELASSHPSLFSNIPVFVSLRTMTAMVQVVEAVEGAARLPGYRAAALSWAPEGAAIDFGPTGALMGYDFHITQTGPRLIEVNTNAGGAFLNAALASAQRACCAEVKVTVDPVPPERGFAVSIVDMFTAEWRLQRGSGKPKTIAIVDNDPAAQYLYPEFRLAKALLEERGIATIIADASTLVRDGGALAFNGRAIDLVYNRLVDFGLDEPGHSALRSAYLAGDVVVTPNPHVHALFADKRNLTILSNGDLLAQWGLSVAHLDTLRTAVPVTVVVTPANADVLWANRRDLFFKPARGHGSKAAYRGAKLTRKVWVDILPGEYVAQTFAAPSARAVEYNGAPTKLKIDARLYTYAGAVILAAARLYQGQTTNMRTPGGGFAPLLEMAS